MTNTPRFENWCRCEGGDWHPWSPATCIPDSPEERGGVVPVTPIYSAALDEIWRGRNLMAMTALMLRREAAHSRTSQRRRDELNARADLLQRAARGEVVWPHEMGSVMVTDEALKVAGAKITLTRWAWEERTFAPVDKEES